MEIQNFFVPMLCGRWTEKKNVGVAAPKECITANFGFLFKYICNTLIELSTIDTFKYILIIKMECKIKHFLLNTYIF